MTIARTSRNVLVSALFGLLAGGAIATVSFALVNFHAEDGPYFSPALVAMAVVFPAAIIILLLLLVSIAWTRFRGPVSRCSGLAMGTLSGVVAGLILSFVVFASSKIGVGDILNFILISLVQGCSTFFCFAHLENFGQRQSGA